LQAVKYILAYIKGIASYGIIYQCDGSLNPIKYVDSDFAGYKDTRQSTEGNVFLVARGTIS